MEKHNVRNTQADISSLAGQVLKEDFLKQLKVVWFSHISKNANIDHEVRKARKRIERSGLFYIAFKKAGITDEDLGKVITEILEEKKK